MDAKEKNIEMIRRFADRDDGSNAERDQVNYTFERSLSSLTVADVAPEYAAAHPEGSRKKHGPDLFAVVRFFVIVLCLGIFAYSVWQLVGIFRGYREADDLYDDYQKEYENLLHADRNGVVEPMKRQNSDKPMGNYGVTENPDVQEEIQETSLRFQRLRVYLSNLSRTNPDTYGFISIDGTRIAYPVVQSEDNKFYLTHGFDGKPLKAGAIFVDYRNDSDVTENRNLVLYGHNMQNGGMFHDLIKYLSEDFFMETDIEFVTFDGIFTFEVFAIYEVSKYEPYYATFFPSDEEFLDFCREAEERSVFHKENVVFSPDDVILTLSTCVSGSTSVRYAIHAKLVSVDN